MGNTQVNMLTNKLHPCTLTSMAEDGSIYPDLRSRLATDLRRISRWRNYFLVSTVGKNWSYTSSEKPAACNICWISRSTWPCFSLPTKFPLNTRCMDNNNNNMTFFEREIRGRQGGYKFLDPIDIACSIDIWKLLRSLERPVVLISEDF